MIRFKRNCDGKGILPAVGLIALTFSLALALALALGCSGGSSPSPAVSPSGPRTFTPVPASAAAPTDSSAPAPNLSPLPAATATANLAGNPELGPGAPSAVAEESLIQLADPLDEPEFYCVDVPGFQDGLRTDRPLQAHTCKPGAADELFIFNRPAPGQLYMESYELCLEADGDLAYTRPCTDSPAQRFTLSANGVIRLTDGERCLAVAGGSGEPAGGLSHVRRDLRLVRCDEVEPTLSRWLFPGSNPQAETRAETKLMYSALESAQDGDPWAIERMGDSGNPAYIPVLVELLRFPWRQVGREVDSAIYSALDRIAAQNPAIEEIDADPLQDEWFLWVLWLGEHPEVMAPPGFAGWKGQLFDNLVDPEIGAFLYDGVKTNIRLEEIVWGGVRKDGIPDLTNPPTIAGADALYLHPDDRVFGVSFNGEHRAYPHRIVNAHEMANDVVGGVPFALAY